MNINNEEKIEVQEPIIEPEVEVEPVVEAEPVAEPVVEVEPVAEPEPEFIPEPEPQPEPEVVGVVSNCAHLNIRKGANKSASIVTVIPVKTEVKIDPKKSNRDWYKVCTAFGIEGFCMKEYITIKQ